ncbi:hypothetical protein ACHAQJ_001003 [Trichoderma viride]
MSPGAIESKDELRQGVAHIDVKNSEVLGNQDLMSDAVDGENREHEMGVWQAVKTHPWACLWAFIMCFTIANSLTLLVVGQALEGVPWGLFIANAPAYASEIVPLPLRGACTATLQMSWSIGSIIVAAATLGYNKRNDEWSWRVPLALQWIFPTPLLVLIFIAPESPWWLIRRGRKEEAIRSIERLGGESAENSQKTLAMMERTVEIEKQMGGAPTLLDLFKGTDLRRTTITCLMYASQNFAGNLIANQATFFFERE